MATNPGDMSMEDLAQAHRSVGDEFYRLNDEMNSRLDAHADANPITDDELR